MNRRTTVDGKEGIQGTSAQTDMAPLLAELIADVAEGLEARLGYVRAIKTAGGPYMASLVIVAERKLNEAAVEAIQRIINNPHMKPSAN
jgi:hypothetical protein